MSKRRKNAGEGYGFMFSGAFTEKKDAMKKERERKGSFIKGIPTRHGYRYVVMTPRENPPRRRKKNPRTEIIRVKPVRDGWVYSSQGRLSEPFSDRESAVRAASNVAQLAQSMGRKAKVKVSAGRASNPMDLVVMGAGNPSSSREIVLQPGERVTFRMNPSGSVCGAAIGGYTCSREPGHRGPHLPQGATLRPASRHNWGRRNPPAEELRETFVGRPVDRVDNYREEHMPAADYALIGKLLALYVRPLKGGQVLVVKTPGALVVSDHTARQLWFVAGDQDVTDSLEQFGARDSGIGKYELGEAVRIDYKQRKEHVPQPEIDEWRHEFGEEDGKRPRLYFDARHKRLLLEGGNYRIEKAGIIN